MKQRMSKWVGTHPFVGDVRGNGLMLGVEIVTDKQKKTIAGKRARPHRRTRLRARPLVLGAGESTVRLSPPLIRHQKKRTWPSTFSKSASGSWRKRQRWLEERRQAYGSLVLFHHGGSGDTEFQEFCDSSLCGGILVCVSTVVLGCAFYFITRHEPSLRSCLSFGCASSNLGLCFRTRATCTNRQSEGKVSGYSQQSVKNATVQTVGPASRIAKTDFAWPVENQRPSCGY